MARDQVFISYAHEDKSALDELQKVLTPFVTTGAVNAWDDTKIKPGANWRDEINRALASAKVGVLLVSPDFLASEFIMQEELPVLLEAANRGELTVIWIALRPCLYEATDIGQYQAANNPSKPLSSLSKNERGDEFVSICKQIKAALEAAPLTSSTTTSSTASPSTPSTATSPTSNINRMELIQNLNGLVAAQFNTLLFTLNPPPGIVPGAPAPQADRVFALLGWAESPTGCGLDALKQTLDQVVSS